MIWDQVWNVLIDVCGARPDGREEFVHYMYAEPLGHKEFRFMGALGFGGKLYQNGGGVYVSCYKEDRTPERAAMIEAANGRLVGLAAQVEARG